jgi:excisionase family DNA binding protein
MTTVAAFKPLSKDDLAEVLGVSIRTVENWVNDGVLPAPTKLGNRVYWHPTTFYGWLDRRLSSGTGSLDVTPAVSGVGAPKPEKSKPRGPAAPVRTELDKVRNRTQAQLDALMS